MHSLAWKAALAFSCLIGHGDARAEDSFGSTPYSQSQWVSYGFVDIKGRVVEFPWTVGSLWIWAPYTQKDPEAEKSGSTLPPERPFLRTWVEVRPPHALVEAKSKRGTLVLGASDAPFKPKRGVSFSIDSDTPTNQVSLKLKDEKGETREYTFFLNTAVKKPLFWVHQTCKDLGYQLNKKSDPDGKFLYTALYCTEQGDSANLYLFTSPDAEVRSADVPGRKGKGTGWTHYFMRTPAKARALGTIVVSAKGAKETSAYAMSFAPIEAKSRLAVSAGLGGTVMAYTEGPTPVHVSEFGLTGKFIASYTVVQDLLDLGGNAFFTLVPAGLKVSSAQLPLARFYGINGRAGLLLPATPFNRLYTLSLGWYFWGMLVSNQLYGVQALNGPQAFLSMRTPYSGPRSYFAYLKLAMMAEGTRLQSLSNREVALGGGYQLDARFANAPMTLTLDVAQAKFTSEVQGNTLRLMSVSLGVQFGL
jgi:hypothetical protein